MRKHNLEMQRNQVKRNKKTNKYSIPTRKKKIKTINTFFSIY